MGTFEEPKGEPLDIGEEQWEITILDGEKYWEAGRLYIPVLRTSCELQIDPFKLANEANSYLHQEPETATCLFLCNQLVHASKVAVHVGKPCLLLQYLKNNSQVTLANDDISNLSNSSGQFAETLQ